MLPSLNKVIIIIIIIIIVILLLLQEIGNIKLKGLLI